MRVQELSSVGRGLGSPSAFIWLYFMSPTVMPNSFSNIALLFTLYT